MLDNMTKMLPLMSSTPFLQMITDTTIWYEETVTQKESCITKVKVSRWNMEIIDASIRVEERVVNRALPSRQQIQELHGE